MDKNKPTTWSNRIFWLPKRIELLASINQWQNSEVLGFHLIWCPKYRKLHTGMWRVGSSKLAAQTRALVSGTTTKTNWAERAEREREWERARVRRKDLLAAVLVRALLLSTCFSIGLLSVFLRYVLAASKRPEWPPILVLIKQNKTSCNQSTTLRAGEMKKRDEKSELEHIAITGRGRRTLVIQPKQGDSGLFLILVFGLPVARRMRSGTTTS